MPPESSDSGGSLDSCAGCGVNYEYTYDLNGIRSSKTVTTADGTVTYSYLTQNGKVVRQTWGGNFMDFIYDNAGHPYAIVNGNATSASIYYYVLNQQGDVIRILGPNNTVAATYTYNAWGEVISSTGWMANQNPLRYRGYFQDNETGFYYLQSRYYDPEIGRFINADSFASTGQGFLGCNMFAYCLNTPVMLIDQTGSLGVLFWSFVGSVVISGAANAYTTAMNDGTFKECSVAFFCGGLGTACGFGLAYLTGFSPQGNVAGRAVSTIVCDLSTSFANNGTLTTEDWLFSGVDATMDVCYSAVGYYYTDPFKSELGKNILNAGIDAVTDVLETYLFFTNHTTTQEVVKPGGQTRRNTGCVEYEY